MNTPTHLCNLGGYLKFFKVGYKQKLSIVGLSVLLLCATGMADRGSFQSAASGARHALDGADTVYRQPRPVRSDTKKTPANFDECGTVPAPNYNMSQQEVNALIAQKKVDVPYYTQKGATCGLYALQMAMAYHHYKSPKKNNRLPRATSGDIIGEKNSKSLYEFAKENDHLWNENGDTTHWGLVKVAKAYGYNASSDNDPFGPTVKDLKDELRNGNPVLISVKGVDQETGRPLSGSKLMAAGHWVLVEGFAKAKDGTEYAIIKHGWSGGSVIWRLDEFEKAWNSNFSATVYLRPK
ncbi:MAG: C39 family peptidase [Deltaproteobacteria bacterium]